MNDTNKLEALIVKHALRRHKHPFSSLFRALWPFDVRHYLCPSSSPFAMVPEVGIYGWTLMP